MYEYPWLTGNSSVRQQWQITAVAEAKMRMKANDEIFNYIMEEEGKVRRNVINLKQSGE